MTREIRLYRQGKLILVFYATVFNKDEFIFNKADFKKQTNWTWISVCGNLWFPLKENVIIEDKYLEIKLKIT